MIKKYFKVVKTNITPPKEVGQNYLWIDTSEDTWVWKIYRDGAWREIGIGDDVIDSKLAKIYDELNKKEDQLPVLQIKEFEPIDVWYDGRHINDQFDLFSAAINGPDMTEAILAALGITRDFAIHEFILCIQQVDNFEYTKPSISGFEWDGANGTYY